MKNRITKITAVLSAAALLAGCTQQETGQPANDQSAPDIPKAEQLFQCKALTQPQEGTELLSLEYYDGQLYVLRSEADGSVSVCTCNRTGVGAKRFSYTPSGENAYVSDFCVNADGEFVFSVQSGSNPDMPPEEKDPDFDWDAYWDGYVRTYTLDILSADGALLRSAEVPASGGVKQDENGNYLILSAEGTGTVTGYLVPADGTAAELSDMDTGYFTYFGKAADGSLYLTAGIGNETVLRKWDPQKAEFMDMPFSAGNLFIHGMIPGTAETVPYYLLAETGIYAAAEDGTLSEIVNFMDSGISDAGDGQLFCTGENTFTGILRNDSGRTYLAEISPRTEAEQKQEAKILTLGCYGIDSAVSDAISGFNSSQKEYRIQAIDYARYDDDYETENVKYKGLLRLNEDIAAGNTPDILLVSEMNFLNLAKKGVLMNLYDVMGTNDTFAKEDFLPNYLKANETDGALYWISPGFRLNTLFANTALTGGKESWTLQEFVDICRQCDAQGIQIIKHQTREDFMNLVTDGNSFVNFENSTCCFDDPAFLDALKFAEEMYIDVLPDFENMTEEETEAYYYEDASGWMNGERLVYDLFSVSSYSDYLDGFCIFGDCPAAMIGQPTLGDSDAHYITSLNYMYAISSTCSDPEAAWKFIHMQLDTDPEAYHGFSVVEDLLKENLKFQMEWVNAPDTGGGLNGVTFEYPIVTQEDIDAFYEMLRSIDDFSMERTLIYDIYNDVMQDFYDGTKSAEQTAEELQDRVSLYLMENQ
ncbi:MAG: extracellular solute-binding protein [Ruminococcus sp.]|nr:extracellular solute-binding protein [Ruminococcus sp.]